jgi:hypothetical protein
MFSILLEFINVFLHLVPPYLRRLWNPNFRKVRWQFVAGHTGMSSMLLWIVCWLLYTQSKLRRSQTDKKWQLHPLKNDCTSSILSLFSQITQTSLTLSKWKQGMEAMKQFFTWHTLKKNQKQKSLTVKHAYILFSLSANSLFPLKIQDSSIGYLWKPK